VYPDLKTCYQKKKLEFAYTKISTIRNLMAFTKLSLNFCDVSPDFEKICMYGKCPPPSLSTGLKFDVIAGGNPG
jgi:hypothetical protein